MNRLKSGALKSWEAFFDKNAPLFWAKSHSYERGEITNNATKKREYPLGYN